MRMALSLLLFTAIGLTGMAPAAADSGVVLSPTSGPIGTVVQVSGFVPPATRGNDTHPSHGLYADISRDCELEVDTASDHLTVDTKTGAVSGSFVILGHGTCRMTDDAPRPVPAGKYELWIGCTACGVASFTITRGSALPFTGAPVWLLLIAGIAAIVAGTAMHWAVDGSTRRATTR